MLKRYKIKSDPQSENELFLCTSELSRFFDVPTVPTELGWEGSTIDPRVRLVVTDVEPRRHEKVYTLRCAPHSSDWLQYRDGPKGRWRDLPFIVSRSVSKLVPDYEGISYVWIEL